MYLLPELLKRQGGGGSGSGSNGAGGNTNGGEASTTTLSVSSSAVATAEASATSATSTSSKGGSNKIALIVVLSIVGVLLIISLAILLQRMRLRHKDPKYIPTPFLKKLWSKWEPSPMRYRLPTQNDHLEPISSRQAGSRASGRSGDPPSSFDTTAGRSSEPADITTQAAEVNRNTSVRSVMTLPAYHQNALQNEQVLGREGERGGIDVVIEFPETVDEEEERRDEEMEALYQVRLARRRENEEREERRRERREARERGDYVALREIAARARATSGASAGRTVEELRAEHDRIKKERQRAVSSVSYADLGVARHDGTRLRANSNDSERQGLLGDAASIGASSRHHRRDRSASSILSIDTTHSGMPSPGLTRSRANSRPESPGHLGHSERAGSSPEMIEHEDIPPNSPPGYENVSLDTPHDERRNPMEPPPNYSSPIVGRGEHVSPFDEEIPLQVHVSPRANSNSPPLNSPPAKSTIFARAASPAPPGNEYHPSPLRRQASISERREYEPAFPSPPLHPLSHQNSIDSRHRSGSTSRDSSGNGGGRRASNPHVGQLISERRTSSQSPLSGHRTTPPLTEGRRSSRGLGGAPQLPSLRLGGLPRIEVDPGSPAVGGREQKAVTPIAELEQPDLMNEQQQHRAELP